jgi:hypothetical protein
MTQRLAINRWILQTFSRQGPSFAFQTRISVILVAILAFVAAAAVGFLQGIPQPQTHDEFSYLLAADTFLHGRLTNPTHPMWVHFETMHVIHQPSYMSRYMPAQGLFLAMGSMLGGHPIIGVWLSVAFMCAAVCWMLSAWLPTRWALLGGIFAIIHPYFGVGNYWAQSYWGGAVSAGGGALVIGGARYLMLDPRKSYAAALVFGLAILANSRPYEGFILSIPVGLALLIWLIKNRRTSAGAVAIRYILLICLPIGLLTLCGMAYYNFRITGNLGQVPYLLYERTYSASALLIWQHPADKPIYHHRIMEDFHTKFELPYYLAKHSIIGFVRVNVAILVMYFFVAMNVLAIPVIGSASQLLGWVWQDRSGRLALLIYSFFALGMMLPSYSLPHYWAPITALNHLFVLQGIRFWRFRDRRTGQLMLVLVPALCLVLLSINFYHSMTSYDPVVPHIQRAKMLSNLERGNDKHLVLVQYGPHHSFNDEWVFNEADIDAAKVVWARDMGLPKNCELVNYFRDRVIWSIEIDDDKKPVEVQLYPKQSCPLQQQAHTTS